MPNDPGAVERFTGYVGLAAMDRPFISKAQERQLLGDGIAKFGLTADQARGVLLAVAQTDDIRVERDIDTRIQAVLDRFGGKRKKLGRKRFEEAAAIYRGMTGDALSPEEARLRVKRVMESEGFRAKRGGWTMTRRWYRRVDKAAAKKRNGVPAAATDS